MDKFSVFDWIAYALVVVGAINWGLIGIAKFDLVAAIFNEMSYFTRSIYGLVGIAGLWLIFVALREVGNAG